MTLYKPLVGKQLLSTQMATSRMNVWEGSVRSGKTIASIIAWIDYVRRGPRGDLLMVGKTERTLKRNILGPIVEMLGKRARLVEGAGEMWIGTQRIYLVGANDVRAEQKIRGMTLAGAYVDEATLIPESMWRMLGTRLSVRRAQLFATTNPDNPRHWLKLILDQASTWLRPDGTVVRGGGELDLTRFSFTLADNPHLDPEYLKALKAEYQGLWRRRFILGEWVIAEGAIYDMWDESRHVVPAAAVPRMDRMVAVGIDYGTRNPFAAELVGIAAGKLWALDQWRWDSAAQKRQLTSQQYAEAVKGWVANRGIEWIYVDPSAADFRQTLYSAGVPGVMAANNDVVPGIRTVASMLGADKLMISDACTGLISEFAGYAWDEKAALLGQDKPIKVNDHDLDALRYAVHSSAWIWKTDLGIA